VPAHSARLRRLKDAVRGLAPCPECTLAADDRRPIEVVYEDAPSGPGGPGGHCPGCGQSMRIVVRVVYDGPAVGVTGGGA
jgi:hypothetical protein